MAPTGGTLVFTLRFLANCDGFVLFSCCHSEPISLTSESVEDAQPVMFNDEEEAKSCAVKRCVTATGLTAYAGF